MRRIAGLGGSGGTFDSMTAQYIKAGEYVAVGDARIGFVANNSIAQGEQVASVAPELAPAVHDGSEGTL